MKTAIYPGSFDPVTLGHLHIIRRLSAMFEEVRICILVNGAKSPLFTGEERAELLRRTTSELPNVKVDTYHGLLVDYAAGFPNSVVVRGVRNSEDFAAEFQMAQINHGLCPTVETLFLPAEPAFLFHSSSAVKELGRCGAELTDYLSAEIIPLFMERMNGK